MPVTMREVAELAGVSPKTVSNVINHRPYVTPKTRKKVQDAVTTLGYHPNRSAQALRTRRAQALAVIIPDIQNDFFTSVVRGVEDTAYEAGYMLLLCDVGDDAEREQRLAQILSVGTVSGMILCTADEKALGQRIEALRADNIPVVLIDRIATDGSVDSVLADNVRGSYDAVQHFLSHGHRRIGVIAGPEHLTPGRERLQGYINALRDHGLIIEDELIRRTDFKIESALRATQEFLKHSSPPTALLVCSGMMALGTVQVIRDSGLRMPDDLALIVFDDPVWSRVIDPPISTIAQPSYEMGKVATELLLNRVTCPDAPLQQIRLPTNFIHRKSCCPARQSA